MDLFAVLPVIGGLVLPHVAARAAAGFTNLATRERSGEQATGEVISTTDVRQRSLPAGTSLADITFRVRLPDGTSYLARSRIGFTAPDRRARIARLGALLPLRVNPWDKSQVMVDVAALGIPVTVGP